MGRTALKREAIPNSSTLEKKYRQIPCMRLLAAYGGGVDVKGVGLLRKQ
jgi:hypothetical protein